MLRPRVRQSDDYDFIQTQGPTRQREWNRYREMYDSDIAEQVAATEPEVGRRMAELIDTVKEEEFVNTAGKGYRKLGEPLTRGKEKGKYELIPDKPTVTSEEEQDVLNLIALCKAYDFEMSGDRVSHDLSHANLQKRIYDFVANKVKSASIGRTGQGGVIGMSERRNHPDVVPISDEDKLAATVKFISSNGFNNTYGQQPGGMLDRKGNISSYPVEHLDEPFQVNPAAALQVDNRDLGSTFPNSVTRNETDKERVLELLYNKIVDENLRIESTYGVPLNSLMKEYGMKYSVNQDYWDPNKYSGIEA